MWKPDTLSPTLCFVAERFVAGHFVARRLSLSLNLSFNLSFSLSLNPTLSLSLILGLSFILALALVSALAVALSRDKVSGHKVSGDSVLNPYCVRLGWLRPQVTGVGDDLIDV